MFAEVLGLESVGTGDSFFDLGGDSISSMLLVARARRAGMVVAPQEVFEQKTPAALAAVAAGRAPAQDMARDAGTGVVPAAPVMCWLAERGADITRFSQSVVVVVPPGLGVGRLADAMRAVLDHHDVLRARLEQPPGQAWRLVIGEPGAVPGTGVSGAGRAGRWARRVDAAGLDDGALAGAARRVAREAAGRLDPVAGVMVQAVWLDRGPQAPGRLVVVIHHLVVDGVSWRILVPDLAAAWQAAGPGGRPVLEPVPASFRSWALLLAERARDAEVTAQLPAWVAVLDGGDVSLAGRALDPARDTAGTVRSVSAVVPAEVTAALLGPVPAVFHGGVNDVLLAGLAVAVAAWRARRGEPSASVLVDVEGHGREPGDAGAEVDLSRTVGWFTSIYPVRLDAGTASLAEVAAGGAAAGDVVKRVKEQLRAVPGSGLGFGLLRYLNPQTGPVLAGLPVPQIAFNYLGRFTATDGHPASVDPYGSLSNGNPSSTVAGAWPLAGEQALGGNADERLPAAHALGAVAIAADLPGGPELTLRLSWPAALLDVGEVRQLGEDWLAALSGIAAHAARPGAGGHTPSDFPLVALAQEQVAELEAGVPGLAEVWPLSPLQEGLLFHALYRSQGPDVYVIQHVFGLLGPLDTEALQAAGLALLGRHPNLRASFCQPAGLSQPVQVISREVVLPWQEEDLSALGEQDAVARAERLADAERDRRFDPAVPPLLRFLLIRLGPEQHQLVITSHHILTDGWSWPVLARELFAVYSAGGDPASLPRVTPYREFLVWLAAQDARRGAGGVGGRAGRARRADPAGSRRRGPGAGSTWAGDRGAAREADRGAVPVRQAGGRDAEHGAAGGVGASGGAADRPERCGIRDHGGRAAGGAAGCGVDAGPVHQHRASPGAAGSRHDD